MDQKDIDHVLSSVKAPIDHPLFYSRIFALVTKQRRLPRKKGENFLQHVVIEEYEELSRRLDRAQVQESSSVRNVLRTRQLARLLINEKGELKTEILPRLISYLKEHLYSLGPQRQYDAKRQEQILKVLELLNSRKDLVAFLKKFNKPFANRWAEELIRQTLQLPATTNITDAHTRQAVLSAWMCYLRQNVGSCFATAPAEIIHDEQPELFLQDVHDLIATGTLKRTFGGVEYSVPLSASWGSGDLKKPLLIRMFTKEITPEIWFSPGLIAAFEAIGFLKSENRTKQKVEQLEGWIKPLMHHAYGESYFVITAEEIIRTILLHNLGLTEKQIKEYETRPKGMMQTQLLVSTPVSTKNGVVGDRCAHFLQLFQIATNAFKALSDNALLKAWEFTLASLSDIKFEFTRWNLYASLGLGTNEPSGIGQRIYQTIQDKLEQANRRVQEIQAEYEMVYTQVKTLESRMRHASTEKEMQWLKIDYQSRLNEFYFFEEKRNEAQSQASSLVNLYDNLYKLYVELFKDYFQEVYDADMQEVSTGPFDDSPAGFRLFYKHGRTVTSQWTRIKNQSDYIDALVSFFVATESQIAHALPGKEIVRDLSDVVTNIINYVKTKEFLESAFYRMAQAHHVPAIKDPLEHLDQIEKKPWSYTSGGTMNTLVSCYYRIEDKPKMTEKWVENEMELLVYLADTLKQMPSHFIEPYSKGKRESILMQSPTHAFLLQPTLFPFNETWSNEEFTYIYIRDRFVRPAEYFVESMILNDEMLRFLVQQLSEKVAENYLPRFKSVFGQLSGPLNPIFFREYLVDMLSQDRGLRYGYQPVLNFDEIDSLLYSTLPLFTMHELADRVEKIFSLIPSVSKEEINQLMQLLDQLPVTRGQQPYLGAKQLQDVCKALLCLNKMSTSTAEDYHLHINRAAQALGFAMPTPLLFADTNWVKDLFGFVVNPGTGRLELWRLDYTGSIGYPMSSWKQWLDGSRSDLKLGIYTKPFEYGQS